MKKIITLLLALVMLAGFSSCTVKLSTTTVPGNEIKEPEIAEPVKTYDDMTLEEKMEYKSVLQLVKAEVEDSTLLAPALDKEKALWGYTDLTGKWVVEPTYRSVSAFSGGIATATDPYGDYSVIDRSGKVLWSALDKHTFTYVGKAGSGLINVALDVDSAQTMTYINEEGKTAFDITKLPTTKGISYQKKNYLAVATPFTDGKAAVMRITNKALAEAGKTSVQEMAYIIDTKGAVQAGYPQGIDISVNGFDENMRIVISNNEGFFGLASDSGSIVLACKYLKVLHCDGDLYLICDQNGFWGYADKDGNIVIELKYKNALPFSEGLAAVYDGTAWGFINEQGVTVIAPQFDSVAALKTAQIEDPENSGAFSCGIAVVQKGRFWGTIDSTGAILIAAETEECPVLAVSNGYMSFDYQGGCGVFTVDGKYVFLSRFENVGEFR